jgi:hypothetical protein
LDDLSIDDNGVLRSPMTTVCWSRYVWWSCVHWHWVLIGR